MLIAQAHGVCGSDNECIIQELEKVKAYEGVSGGITIYDDHSTQKETIFKQVQNNTFVKFK
jgi:hypothetical protein